MISKRYLVQTAIAYKPFTYTDVTLSNSVVPVINLTSDYMQTFTGDGTKNNPFYSN